MKQCNPDRSNSYNNTMGSGSTNIVSTTSSSCNIMLFRTGIIATTTTTTTSVQSMYDLCEGGDGVHSDVLLALAIVVWRLQPLLIASDALICTAIYIQTVVYSIDSIV